MRGSRISQRRQVRHFSSTWPCTRELRINSNCWHKGSQLQRSRNWEQAVAVRPGGSCKTLSGGDITRGEAVKQFAWTLQITATASSRKEKEPIWAVIILIMLNSDMEISETNVLSDEVSACLNGCFDTFWDLTFPDTCWKTFVYVRLCINPAASKVQLGLEIKKLALHCSPPCKKLWARWNYHWFMFQHSRVDTSFGSWLREWHHCSVNEFPLDGGRCRLPIPGTAAQQS